jgi:glycosyltransferase involved in cell wall biosynthesis
MIQSVLNHLYNNWELKIVDDGSTDNNKVEIEKYRNHPKVSHITYYL